MDLPKMERNSVCHHVFVLPVMSKKNNSVIFLKKCTADSGFSSFSSLGALLPSGGYHAALSQGDGEHKGGVQVPGLQNPEIPWEARGIVLIADKCKFQQCPI